MVYLFGAINSCYQESEVMSPCFCDNPVFKCLGYDYIFISKIFQQIDEKYTWSKDFYKILINNQAIDEIGENIFHNSTFREIKIYGCSGLKFFNKNAFSKTLTKTEKITISFNERLGDLSVFQAINKLTAVREIELTYNNLSEIPSQAFNNNQTNLWHLTISGPSINKIGQRSFISLVNLKELHIGGTNIDFIPDFAFELKDSTNYPIYIYLDNSSMISSNSFAENAFANTRRPTLLNLNNNKITFLNETVFLPLLQANNLNKINMYGVQGFDCNDCENNWIKTNSMFNKIVLLKCSNGNELDDPRNFENCDVWTDSKTTII